jgi:ankyrin repeat protein
MNRQECQEQAEELVRRGKGHVAGFWLALGEQNLLALEHFLSTNGQELMRSREGKTGKSPLEWCVFLHRHDALTAILAWGADGSSHVEVDKQIDGRTTALGLAVLSHCEACTRLLIEAGADVNVGQAETGRTPLIEAASLAHEKHSAKMIALLLEAGANPDARAGSSFAVSAAASRDHAADIELMAKAGANLDIHAGDGFAPLHYAVDNESARAAEALLKNGADFSLCATGIEVDGVAQDLDPLALARLNGSSQMAGLLYAFAEAKLLRERIGKSMPGAVKDIGRKATRL